MDPSQGCAGVGLSHEALARDGYLGEDKDIVAVPEIGAGDEVEETGPCFLPGHLAEQPGE